MELKCDMDAKKHKELFDLMSSKSSYNGFINYSIFVCLLKKFNCYDEFLKKVEIENLEKYNDFNTNARVLGLSFWWSDSDSGDMFWRMLNAIYVSLIITNEEYRHGLYLEYEFHQYNEFDYLNFIYYFGIDKYDRIFHLLNSVYKNSLFKEMKLKNYFNKNIKIINKMIDLKFKNNKELAAFLKSNGIY